MNFNKKTIRRMLTRMCTLTICLILIITQTACTANEKTNGNTGVSKTGFFLDTLCSITIFGIYDSSGELLELSEDELNQKLLLLITDAFKLCDKYEKMLSKTIETSDVARINAAGGKAVKVSGETVEVIRKGILYGEMTQGAFDITIGKATDLWGFREAEAGESTESGMVGKVPEKSELAETMKHVDYRKIEINGSEVRLLDPEMEIDLGGIAKGYIADKVTQFLEEAGVTSAIVDLGGNIVAIRGKAGALLNAEGEPLAFKVGIKDPLSDSGDIIGIVSAYDKTVVTSGTYERYFVEDGKKYHHILDSKTGFPADTDVLSVTIIADKGHSVDGDALSTSCLALGIEKGTALIQKIDGTEAVFVDTDGNIHTTSNEIAFTEE